MKWERFEVRSTPGLRPADYWPKARNLSSQVWLHGNLTGVGDDLVSAGLTPVWQAKLSFLFWEICSTLQCSSFSLTKSQHAYNDQQGHTWPASANPMTSPGTILLFPHSSSAPPASSNTPTFAGGFARPGPLTHSKPCLNVTPMYLIAPLSSLPKVNTILIFGSIFFWFSVQLLFQNSLNLQKSCSDST